MNCINLRKRSKKGKTYIYCIKRKLVVDFKECSSCSYREYKKVSKMVVKKPLRTCNKKHKLTLATSIPKNVKLKVWERDKHRCIFCHRLVPWNLANSHFIKRSHSGLGIEENIFTACLDCHNKFDDSIYRKKMLPIARKHLKSKYTNWNEDNLIYNKHLK